MSNSSDDSTDWNVYALDASDPDSRLVDRQEYSETEIAQISALMAALAALREAEQELSEALEQYMQLGQTDMKALHFLIVAKHTGDIVTARALAQHLQISTASVTKLLDRLEAGHHILRAPHPHDRRALAITITDTTYETAIETIGRKQARRFHAAARLTTQQRDVVIRFLKDMAHEIALPATQKNPGASPQ